MTEGVQAESISERVQQEGGPVLWLLPQPPECIIGIDVLSNNIVYRIINQRQYHIPKEMTEFLLPSTN